jgi:hypothetical protein
MADTIEIVQGTATVVEIAGPTGPQGPSGSVGATGAQGPQGVPGTGLEVLTTQGDLLYQGASTGQRLAIGSTGQVLKVAGGIPAWGAVSASDVGLGTSDDVDFLTLTLGEDGPTEMSGGGITFPNGTAAAGWRSGLGLGSAAVENTTAFAAALHAADHEAGEVDEIQAMAALVTTEDVSLNGIYVPNANGTTSGGRLVYYKPGTRENTKLEYNVSLQGWYLIKNTVVQLSGQEEGATHPWTPQAWLDPRSPQSLPNGGTVTRAPLEILARRAADGTSNVAPATTSADGLLSSSDKTKLNGIAAGAEVNVQANWTEADSGSDAFILNKPSTFAPSAHSSSHASSGSDPLAPSDIGAQSIFATDSASASVSGVPLQLSSARAKTWTLENSHSNRDVYLPVTGIQTGDVAVLIGGGTVAYTLTVKVPAAGGAAIIDPENTPSGSPVVISAPGQQYRFIVTNPANFNPWRFVAVDSHTHTASAISDSTTAGRALITAADAAAQRTSLGLGTAATSATGDFAAASHSHGNINSSGQVGSVSGLPLVTTTAGAVTTLALGTANQVLRVNSGATAVEFADPAAAGVTSVTGTAPIVSSGGTTPAISVTVGTGANTVAAGNDSRITGAIQSTLVDAKGDLIVATAADTVARLPVGATNGHVLTVDSAEAGGMKWAAAAGGVSNVDSTLADVMSVSGSNLVADDGGTIDSSDPFIKWDDAAGKLVYANPLSRPTGAFYVGLAPTTTALGTNSVNIQSGRDNAAHLAKDGSSVCVGYGARSTSSSAAAVGHNSSSGNSSTALGASATAGNDSVALGASASAGNLGIAIGRSADASSSSGGVAIGYLTAATGVYSVGIGYDQDVSLRGAFSVRPFNAVYWGGTTTDATANVELNLDATATNRMTIAASTAVIADIYVIARRTDNTKFLAARRWVAIRRDGSNNTALIGAVQTIGTDQSEGSPTWTFTIDADDTASVESLRVRVTGAVAENVNWRVSAIYRVVA